MGNKSAVDKLDAHLRGQVEKSGRVVAISGGQKRRRRQAIENIGASGRGRTDDLLITNDPEDPTESTSENLSDTKDDDLDKS
jgi:hypothetical protein